MSRPLSLPDFASLLDSSTSPFEKRIHSRRQTSPQRRDVHLRKKPSVSLATGLIMNNDNARIMPPPGSPIKPRSRDGLVHEGTEEHNEDGNLFYAYALRSDCPSSPPYILTFASAQICTRWWALVKRDFPESARPNVQFFVVRGEHLETIRDDAQFQELRNMWFYSAQENHAHLPTAIPSQTTGVFPASPLYQPHGEPSTTAALDGLTEKLDRLAGIVEKNVEQIQALCVAQSAGLEHMQEITESHSSQIKIISDAQLRLQSLVDQNTAHHIALSNDSIYSHKQMSKSQQQTKSSQDQMRKAQDITREDLKCIVTQLQTLSGNQAQISETCEDMLQRVERLSSSVSQITTTATISDTASVQSANSLAPPTPPARRISPGPRKLNRRIKGVWYEYDDASTPVGARRRRVDSLDTPPKSSILFKNVAT
ncbi:hypothetical protein J1614_003256 [Plenodomus biglobosus]|nr:hypothetical protein J1614_003256 [Plenodomus biglobosus]